MCTHEYAIKVNWDPQDVPYVRIGTLAAEGIPDGITVTTPPEFRQGIPEHWSPEHLFVGSAAVCLMTTFLAIAQTSKLEFEQFRLESTGILDDVDVDGHKQEQITEIHERFYLQLTNAGDEEKADVIEKSKKLCLIANSMKSAFTLEIFFE